MTDAPKKKMSKGCLISIILIGVVLVITVISFMYLPGMLREKMLTSFAELETKITTLNPPGYTTEQIEELFSGAMTAFDSGWVSQAAIKNASETLMGIGSVDSLSADDAVKVLEALQMMVPGADGLESMGGDSLTSPEMKHSDSTVGSE